MDINEPIEILDHLHFNHLNYECFPRLGYSALVDERDYEVCRIYASTGVSDEWLADALCTSVNFFLEEKGR